MNKRFFFSTLFILALCAACKPIDEGFYEEFNSLQIQFNSVILKATDQSWDGKNDVLTILNLWSTLLKLNCDYPRQSSEMMNRHYYEAILFASLWSLSSAVDDYIHQEVYLYLFDDAIAQMHGGRISETITPDKFIERIQRK